jgi:hypothetical protein
MRLLIPKRISCQKERILLAGFIVALVMNNNCGMSRHDGKRLGAEVRSKKMKMQDVIVPTPHQSPEIRHIHWWKLAW